MDSLPAQQPPEAQDPAADQAVSHCQRRALALSGASFHNYTHWAARFQPSHCFSDPSLILYIVELLGALTGVMCVQNPLAHKRTAGYRRCRCGFHHHHDVAGGFAYMSENLTTSGNRSVTQFVGFRKGLFPASRGGQESEPGCAPVGHHSNPLCCSAFLHLCNLLHKGEHGRGTGVSCSNREALFSQRHSRSGMVLLDFLLMFMTLHQPPGPLSHQEYHLVTLCDFSNIVTSDTL